MVNRNMLWLLCLGWSVLSFGQSVSPEALVPAGKTDVTGSYSLSWTLGQVADATSANGDLMLTEGYQQPQLLIESLPIPDLAIRPSTAVELDCTIFPNPSSDRVNVQVRQNASQKATIALLDANGRMLRHESIDLQHYNKEWEVGQLASGTYLFQLYTPQGDVLRSFRLTKI